jgi:hypothetical protein
VTAVDCATVNCATVNCATVNCTRRIVRGEFCAVNRVAVNCAR